MKMVAPDWRLGPVLHASQFSQSVPTEIAWIYCVAVKNDNLHELLSPLSGLLRPSCASYDRIYTARVASAIEKCSESAHQVHRITPVVGYLSALFG